MSETSSWIAIVDDDPSILKALARLLRAHRLSSRTFVSGRDFLEAIQAGQPECLIVDLQMPDMTGLELQHHLLRSQVRIPTIVITAHGDTATRQSCEAAGATGFLTKPLDERDLLAAITSARNAA